MDMEFNSKILIFGEYGIIHHSWALATPYPMFSGHLSFSEDKDKVPYNGELWSFSVYLEELFKRNPDLPFHFSISDFQFDLSQGLYFASSIPAGFGVGSSGALCAALFSRYGKSFNGSDDIQTLQSIFSLMESHFHGKSSGLDPLISYLNSPLLIKDDKSIQRVQLPKQSPLQPWSMFLLNTNRPRRTEPLVNHYLEKATHQDFSKAINKELIPITNQCINHYLENNTIGLFEQFKKLSAFQLEHFEAMIPPLFREYWQTGLQTNDYYLKLCGAGGGGFLLGLSANCDDKTDLFKPYHIRKIP